MHKTIALGVNIDHAATVRQARGTLYPDPVEIALQAQAAGADGITAHLREDRRHIQERDIRRLQEMLTVPLNLEMAATDEMLALALEVKPAKVCLVPERREELTTEGGLSVDGNESLYKRVCYQLMEAGIQVSFFIEADSAQIEATVRCGAPVIELHTGTYANAGTATAALDELQCLHQAAQFALQRGLIVNAGHGLHYHNIAALAAMPEWHEFNIGHSIIARALSCGIEQAVRDMQQLLFRARHQQ